MAWFVLIVAGVLEVVWSLGLKYTQGFTRPVPRLLTGTAIVASMTSNHAGPRVYAPAPPVGGRRHARR